MKKILVITMFIAGFAITSQAQQTVPQQKETKKEAYKKMVADLQLTAEQEKQLKTTNSDFKDKAKELKENQSLSKEQKKEQLLNLAKERTDKLATFLTPEQVSKLADQRNKGHHRKMDKS